MARYCFYCGRELTDGEKCNCRGKAPAGGTKPENSGPATAGTGAGASAQATPGSKGTPTRASRGKGAAGASGASSSSKGNPGGFFRRVVQFFNPFATDAADSRSGKKQSPPRAKAYRQTNYGPSSHSGGRPGSTASSGSARFAWSSIRPSLAQLGRYFIRPAESVSLAASGNARQPVVLVLLLLGAGSGFLLLLATRQTILESLLSINVAPLWENNGFFAGFSIFAQGFSFALLSSLLVALLYRLALRYLYRRPASFQQILFGLCPAYFFTTLFVFAALLILQSSFFNAAMLLLASFAVSALIQQQAMRQILDQDENRSLSLVIFVQIIYAGVLALVLNMLLPFVRALFSQSPVV